MNADRQAWNRVGVMLTQALRRSTETPCVATQDAVWELLRAGGFRELETAETLLRDPERSYPHDFLTVAVGPPRYARALKLATGRTRDEWLDVQSRIAAVRRTA